MTVHVWSVEDIRKLAQEVIDGSHRSALTDREVVRLRLIAQAIAGVVLTLLDERDNLREAVIIQLQRIVDESKAIIEGRK